MAGAIYLMHNNTLLEMSETSYDAEVLLQKLLASHPKLLAGDQMNVGQPRRWMLIGREVGIRSEDGDGFSLDHLFVDQDGILTLVEVKRSKDHRIRREVVGQMLDYAANASSAWPAGALRARFGVFCQQAKVLPADRIADLLGTEMADEEMEDSFWSQVEENLEEGRLRLLFVADEIPSQLRRIIEFLNQHMDHVEVLGLEVKQYTGGEQQALVPRLLGQTVATQQKKASSRTKGVWDEDSFFGDMTETQGSEYAEIARQIVEWAGSRVDHFFWGEGSLHSACVPSVLHKGVKHQLFAIRPQSCTVQIYFQSYQKKTPFFSETLRLELLERLTQIEGVQITSDDIARKPSIDLALLAAPESMQRFLSVFDWVIERIRMS